MKPIVVRAFHLMTTAHSGQTRKDGAPYSSHPLRVWQHVVRGDSGWQFPLIQPTFYPGLVGLYLDGDEAVECASLLHDVPEDTSITLDDIRKEFGDDTTMLVNQLTNDNSLPKKERKQKMIEKALIIDNRARVIKAMDRIDNLFDGTKLFTKQNLLGYTIEAIHLVNNLFSGLQGDRRDRWYNLASGAVLSLNFVIDKIISFGYNDLKVDEFLEVPERLVRVNDVKDSPQDVRNQVRSMPDSEL